MNAITARWRRGLAAAALAAILAAPIGAVAQSGPTSLIPTRPAPGSVPGGEPAAPMLPTGIFAVEPLQAMSGESFGTLDGDAGYGGDLWRGARRAQLSELIPLLPDATRSLAMNAVARRLLLTAATVPPAAEGTADGANLAALRLERVMALGDPRAAAALARLAPGRDADETAMRTVVDAAFLAGDGAAVCRDVRGGIERFASTYWRKALAYCQAIGNEAAAANLSAALLRELAPNDDPAFHALIAALTGDSGARVESLAQPTALHVAMLRDAKLAPPEAAYDTDDAAILAALALLPQGPIEQRIAAAERAEARGALSTPQLAELYASLRFTPAQMDNAVTASESERGPRARALLYAAQARQTVPAARAVLLQRAFAVAYDAGLLPTAARVYGDVLAAIPPTQDLTWFAPAAARALVAAGRTREARAWLAALGGGLGPVANLPAATREVPPLVALLPYDLLTAGAGTWDAARWQRWRAAQGDAAPARASLLLTLLEGLGQPAPDEAWDGLSRSETDPAAHLPSPAVLRTMEVAASTERKGLAILATLVTLGPDGPAGTHPLVLGIALAALRNVGLEAEARALAVDAAVGAGL